MSWIFVVFVVFLVLVMRKIHAANNIKGIKIQVVCVKSVEALINDYPSLAKEISNNMLPVKEIGPGRLFIALTENGHFGGLVRLALIPGSYAPIEIQHTVKNVVWFEDFFVPDYVRREGFGKAVGMKALSEAGNVTVAAVVHSDNFAIMAYLPRLGFIQKKTILPWTLFIKEACHTLV